MSRCKACDRVLKDSDLFHDEDLCKKCLNVTFGDSSYIEHSLQSGLGAEFPDEDYIQEDDGA